MTGDEHQTKHPVDILIDEHEVILGVLAAVEREAARTADGAPLRSDFWLGAADFLQNFADGCHHAKEEELLFPALGESGMPADEGPVGVMLREHVEGRELRARLQKAAEAGHAEQVLGAARAFVLLLREHIEKENVVLFEMARQMITGERAERLSHAFERAESDLGDVPARYRELARTLCADRGAASGQS